MNEPRRYFSFTRLYRTVFEGLPNFKTKAEFAAAIFSYGLDQDSPDFGDNKILQKAWDEVFPDLCYSWDQREQGRHGGKSKMSRKTRKKSVKSEERSPITSNGPLPLPDNSQPDSDFLEKIRPLFPLIAEAPKPLTRAQWEYLITSYGDSLISALIPKLESQIKFEDSGVFWKEHEADGVFELLKNRAEQMTKYYLHWMNETFPKIASMSPHPLTLCDYLELCSHYGRANVLVKLKQMDEKPKLNKAVRCKDVLEDWIEDSINKGENHRFGLKDYDDNPSSDLVPEVEPGYDKKFNMKVCGAYTF